MWELQSQMHQYVRPSIWHYAQTTPDPEEWLKERYADQRWKEETGDTGYEALINQAKDLPGDVLLDEVTNSAIEYAGTTNGGHELYLDSWTRIPWCTEEQMLDWYANS